MKHLFFLYVLLMIPSATYGAQAPSDFKGFVGLLIDIINKGLIPLIFALTFITIMWGVIKAWVIGGGDEKSVDAGKQIATVGIIALVIMTGIWGIISLLRNSFFGL